MSLVPRCPACRIAGFDKIVSVDSQQQNHNGDPWFAIVHCVNVVTSTECLQNKSWHTKYRIWRIY